MGLLFPILFAFSRVMGYTIYTMLDPNTIASIYTIAEIEAQIELIKTAYNNAIKNRSYQLDDMQSRQRVEQHDIDKISGELEVWLKAKSIKSGISYTKLLSVTYTGSHD